MNEFNEWVNREETSINRELFKKHFNFQRPSDMLKTIYTTDNIKKNNDLVNVIKCGQGDLKNEIENMGEKEKEIEKPNKLVDIVERILEFNDLNERGQGLKKLHPIKWLVDYQFF